MSDYYQLERMYIPLKEETDILFSRIGKCQVHLSSPSAQTFPYFYCQLSHPDSAHLVSLQLCPFGERGNEPTLFLTEKGFDQLFVHGVETMKDRVFSCPWPNELP